MTEKSERDDGKGAGAIEKDVKKGKCADFPWTVSSRVILHKSGKKTAL